MADQCERGREERRAADPWTPRAMSRAAMLQAAPQTADAAVKTITPKMNIQPPPVPVGERPGREDQRGERQCIGVDDPLQPGQPRAQARLNPWQRDVHDRDVEQQHERRDADGDARPRRRSTACVAIA
jgi:hypothetical protein